MPEADQAREMALRMTTWLSQAPPELRSKLLRSCSLRSLAPGDALHFAGDDAQGMYCVVTGSLKVQVSSQDHGPFFAHILGPGTWGGEGPAIIRGTRPVTLVASTQTSILFLQRPAMIELATEHPAFWEFYAVNVMSHLTVALGAVADLLIREHDKRLISVLLRLGNCRDLSTPAQREALAAPITMHVSQDELATASNVARTTANRVLLKLKAAGLVDLAYGRIQLLAPKSLRRILVQPD